MIVVNTVMKIEYIYALYFELDGQKEYFYIGRTNNPTVRLSGHRSSLKCGDETLKYHFLRTVVEPGGFEWGMEVIKEIPEDDYPYDYEDFYVIKYIRDGYMLTNLKHGDLEKRKVLEALIYDKKIRSVQDVRLEREHREKRVNDAKYAKSEALRLKVLSEDEQKDDIEIICDAVADLSRFKREIKWSLSRRGWKKLKGEMCQTKVVDGKYTFKRQKKGDKCVVMIDDNRYEGKNYKQCYDYVVRGFMHWSDRP